MQTLTSPAESALRQYGTSIRELAGRAYNAIERHGGFTMDVSGSAPIDGYTIGQGTPVKLTELTMEAMIEFVAQNYIAIMDDPSLMIGGWRNYITGVIELDLNRWWWYADLALRESGETHRSVFDVATMDCLIGQPYPCEICALDPAINTLLTAV